MEKKLQKIYLTYYNLLIALDLQQTHCQILSTIFLKEFIKLKVNTNTMIRYAKLVEMHKTTVFMNRKDDFKDDLIEYKFLCCNINCQQMFDEKTKK